MEGMVGEIDVREQLNYDWERRGLGVKSILQKNKKSQISLISTVGG